MYARPFALPRGVAIAVGCAIAIFPLLPAPVCFLIAVGAAIAWTACLDENPATR